MSKQNYKIGNIFDLISKIEDKSNMEVFEDEKLKTRLNELK